MTAANGAESHYNLEGNAARKEPLELARQLDDKIMRAWFGHPYYCLIDNATSFPAKLDRTIKAALVSAGLEDVRSTIDAHRRKFVIQGVELPALPEDVKYLDFEVEHRMLYPSKDGSTFNRLRKRGTDGNYIYTMASTKADGEQLIESRRNLNGREYEAMLKFVDPAYHVVSKLRRCFMWEGRYYQVDKFLHQHEGLVVMEAYIPSDMHIQELPPFISSLVVKEVTQDPAYKLINISKSIRA